MLEYLACLCISLVFMMWFIPWAQQNWTNKPVEKKEKLGIPDEEIYQEFMDLVGNRAKKMNAKMGYPGELGILDQLNKKKKDEQG